ncbi:adenylyltransferase/cytidyltransferase family protein [Fluviispira multicolorata]|uniref:Adenylyltransferase/cytidyltransferase family protein n=1 Tax=Fluviispira multicolorata TaxID=2654512 RepID=A0A833N5A5_9BACT|nr:adenylyltransferase/cytidyltransferase family protein [Fluviispira multicolorata]KAB8033174.1 adenylyltransferase/cytidyltransferase family protein [Fluviispira multicolorata]
MQKQNSIIYDATVFIGRFQPFHKGHVNSVKIALRNSKQLIIVLGSYRLSSSVRGPWSAEERIAMIQSALSQAQLKKIKFICIRDRLYNEEIWKSNIINEVEKKVGFGKSIALIGHEKDSSSYYLRLFPQWNFMETGNYQDVNATDFRINYFLEHYKKSLYDNIPEKIIPFLQKYKKSANFKVLKAKFNALESLKVHIKKGAEKTVCNALIMCGGYFLFVKRKEILSQGLYSLPEANPMPQESYFDCISRGLKEETGLNISTEKLRDCYKKEGTFDYAERNPLEKSVSHTLFFEIKEIPFPKVTAGKNIAEVEWVLYDDVYLKENCFYSDFFQIIQWFLRNN